MTITERGLESNGINEIKCGNLNMDALQCLVFYFSFFKNFYFSRSKAEESLPGMDLQEKESQKD